MIRLHGRKENKMQYEAIFELDDVLNDLHIEHIFRPMFDGFQIIIESNKYRVSFIEHMGSYGSSNDLIEAWDGFGEPIGHLDVFACLEYLSERRLLKELQ